MKGNMTVRAKFQVGKITNVQLTHHYKPDGSFVNEPIEAKTIDLHVVDATDPANRSFFASTPTGSLQLTTINPKAAEQFQYGKQFYVDFIPV
jgi:hypothetical protein